MGILLIGMTAILGLLSFGAGMSRTAVLRTAGASAVEAVVADLEATLFPAELDDDGRLVLGEPRELLAQPVPGHPGVVYDARARPDPDELDRPGGPLEYRVDVEVRWQSRGVRRVKRFTTLLLREIPFGESLRMRFVEGRTGPAGPPASTSELPDR
jgi:hypothetical protein